MFHLSIHGEVTSLYWCRGPRFDQAETRNEYVESRTRPVAGQGFSVFTNIVSNMVVITRICNKMRMSGWTDGRVDGRTGGRADGRTGGRADGRTGGRADGRTGGRTDGRTDGSNFTLSLCHISRTCHITGISKIPPLVPSVLVSATFFRRSANTIYRISSHVVDQAKIKTVTRLTCSREIARPRM